MVIWFKLDNKPHKPGIDKKKPYFQQVGCSFPNLFIASSKPPQTMSLVFLSSPLSGHAQTPTTQKASKGVSRRSLVLSSSMLTSPELMRSPGQANHNWSIL